MADSFEKRRTTAQFIAICDMFGLILQSIILLCLFLLGLADLIYLSRYSPDIVHIFVFIVAPILIVVIILDFPIIKGLYVATGGQGEISVVKARDRCDNWVNLNKIWLVIKIFVMIFAFTQRCLIAFLVGASIRVYMLCIVDTYKKGLVELFRQNRNQDRNIPVAPILNYFENQSV